MGRRSPSRTWPCRWSPASWTVCLLPAMPRVTVVGATSGDTGGAAIEAFRGSKRVDAIVLFPNGRVSDVQRRMMTTATEPNVHAVAIDGTFDDCQALVKAMFNDLAFRDRVKLAGVNSINWARVVAQITYYFVAATALGGPHRAVSFSVPTGNFGDIFAGYAAKRMGLPVERLVIATNDNDILRRTHATGAYEVRGVVATTSPSMDIQVSSNFERYLFEATNRDAGWVRGKMGGLVQSGRFELSDAVLAAMRADFDAAAASADEVAACIRHTQDSAAATCSTPIRPAASSLRKKSWRRERPRTSCSPPPTPQSFPTPSKRSAARAPHCRHASPHC